MKSVVHFILVNLLLIQCLVSAAQRSSQKMVVPPSPVTASLAKFSEIPVSLYTGIPEITIDLFEIRSGSLSLPISLSYHAGGVRIEEVPSDVGLGWALNASGVIQRTIRGKPDELGWYPKTPTTTVEHIMFHGTYEQQGQLIKDIRWARTDGESDLYSYNVGNQLSGKFFLDQLGNAYSVPLRNVKIERSPFWQITAEDGTVYVFSKDETVSSSYCNEGEDAINTTAWYLSSIRSSDGMSEITFTYDHVQYVYTMLGDETKYFSYGLGDGGCRFNSSCLGTHSFFTHRLKRIDFKNGYVLFNHLTQRCDLVDSKSLDNIELYDKADALIKRVKMLYDYFGDNSDGCNRPTEIDKRLKLLSVVEEGADVSKPPYEFTYNENVELPSRQSYAQDHWGFYNGKLNNHGLVATFKNTLYNGGQVVERGADRRTDPAFAQAGILTKIKYPTGGETLFTYESNTVSDGKQEPDFREELLALSVTDYLVSNLPVPFESTSIVIPSQGAYVEFKNIWGLDQLWQGCDVVQCWVIKDDDYQNPFRQIGNSLNGGMEPWPAGTYKLRLVTDCGYGAVASFGVTIIAKIDIIEIGDTRPVGGLRIKQIEQRPSGDGQSIIKRYRYQKADDPTKSSGVLINFPEYGYDMIVNVAECAGDDFPKNCAYRVRTSYSSYPLATTEGSYIGYKYVVEDSYSNGESRHQFYVYEDGQSQYPYAPVESYDWRRGWLESSVDYSNEQQTLKKVKEISRSPFISSEFRVYGIRTGCISFLDQCVTGDKEYEPCMGPVHQIYPTITEFQDMGQTKIRVFDPSDGTKFNETITDFSYSPLHLQLVETITSAGKTSSAKKEEIVTRRKYPEDYVFTTTPSGSEALGIKRLQDLHVVNEVVEELIIRRTRDQSTNAIISEDVVESDITTFKSDKPYADKVWSMETSVPIPLSIFGTGSGIVANSFVLNTASLSINNAYRDVISYNQYDEVGNLVLERKANDISTLYVWGYDKQHVIAEVRNASNVNDVAYTSFEQNSSGNWTIGPATNPPAEYTVTGKKCYLLSPSSLVSKIDLTPTKTYILSFWYKDNAQVTVTGGTATDISTFPGPEGWTLSTRRVTGAASISISGSGYIDELRLYPADARMVSFTVDPLVGVTSVSDANSEITYYEYDTLGRLKLVRDQKTNIISKYDYRYR